MKLMLILLLALLMVKTPMAETGLLAMPLGALGGSRRHISNLVLESLNGAAIATAAHCYDCTAGQGSSCGGALEAKYS